MADKYMKSLNGYKVYDEDVRYELDTAINNAGYPYTASGASVTVHPAPQSRIDFVSHFNLIQAGEGDPSPSNVRPITAPESVIITRTGENLLIGEPFVASTAYVQNYSYDADAGIIKFHAKGVIGQYKNWVATTYFQLKIGESYIFKYTSLQASSNIAVVLQIMRYDSASGKYIYRRNISNGQTFSLEASDEYALLIIQSTSASVDYDTDIILTGARIYSAADEDPGYAKPTGWAVTVELPDGTYCGEYDSRTGTITRAVSAIVDGATYKAASINTTATEYGSVVYTNIYPYKDLSLSAAEVRRAVASDLHCSHAITVSNMTVANEANRGKVSVSYFSGSEVATFVTLAFYFPASMNITTVAAANEWFAENTPTVTYYPNTASRVQTITPSTLRAASPAQLNYIWTDNGTIDVSGSTDLKWLVNSLLPEG